MIETFAEARAMLDRITFGMPGWSIDLTPGDLWSARLVLTARVENTYQPGERVVVRHESPVPLRVGDDAFVAMVRQSIHRAVIHEADEWIRLDGQMVFDPHR